MENIFYKSKCFNLYNTFYNGQCFRWEQVADGVFEGIAGDKPLRIHQDEDGVRFCCNESDFAFWKRYFDLDTDYASIEEFCKRDAVLSTCVIAGEGMHILRQDLWEVLISFLISQNNNIARIKKIIANISCAYGNEIQAYDKVFYTFPTPEKLAYASISELQRLGLGYRAEYIKNCSDIIKNQPELLENILNMEYAQARESLLSIKGVGPKVANCILLFGLRHFEAFPVDTWIYKAMMRLYPESGTNKNTIELYAKNRFGVNAGMAQQYIFYAARQGAIKFDN